jgi:hypothetical protein
MLVISFIIKTIVEKYLRGKWAEFAGDNAVAGNIHGRFCKKILGLPTCPANGMAEIELERSSRRGKVMCLAVKYWQ